MNVTQVKDAIRYMSRADKIEISRWLDGELAGGPPFRSDRVDQLQRSGGIERTLKFTQSEVAQLSGKDVSVQRYWTAT